MNKTIAQRVAERAQKTKTGAKGVSHGLAETEVKKLLRKVEPKTNRRKTIEAIAAATAKNDILMTWFADAIKDYGRLDDHSTGDLFGEALWSWKEDWEIREDNEEFDGLSQDRLLVKLIEQATKKWMARGGGVGALPRDYAEAEMIATQYKGLADLLKDLASGRSRDEEGDRKAAIAMLKALHKILK